MAKRKPQRGKKTRRRRYSSNRVDVRRSSDGRSWVLVHPRCVRDRSEDVEEVETMVEAGEYDIAIDELRWLLADCPEFIAAHRLLGELAIVDGDDVSLARGHFGAGYQIGLQALRRAKLPAPLLYSQAPNRTFFEAGRGLAWSLERLGKRDMAEEIVETLVRFDPSDPLELRQMLDQLRTGDAPIVDLLTDWRKPDDSPER